MFLWGLMQGTNIKHYSLTEIACVCACVCLPDPGIVYLQGCCYDNGPEHPSSSLTTTSEETLGLNLKDKNTSNLLNSTGVFQKSLRHKDS